jgi:MarR family transcriptional regulator, organic hydroperoxide resistance regulator
MTKMTDSQANIYLKLMKLMMRSKRHMAEIMEKRKMTPVQGMLLTLFDDQNGRSMNELSVLMGCDASNVTGLIDRLDSQGLIERVVDPNDRRVKLIRLSDKGFECRAAMLEHLRDAEVVDMQKLTPQERESFIKVVDKLTSET